MAYIKSPKGEGCIFCDKPKEGDDSKNFILMRGKKCFVMMNIFPYNSGHLMVSPYRHAKDFEDLTDEESLELVEMVKKSIRILKRALNPHGFNIGINLGSVAGAGIEDHIHVHIVPRWSGDTNFMPVIGDTKVIPEMLQDTYRRLIEASSESS